MENKTVLITGASRGIGRETARIFASKGYNLIINYSTEIDEEKYKKDLQLEDEKVLFVKADISSYDEVEKMKEIALKKFEKIDVLINNAGITKDNLIIKMSKEDFERVLDVNVTGTFNCMKIIGRHMMKNKKGVIVSVSSVVGIIGNIGQINYAASKASIIGMTKTLAKELASRNIRCNAVAPGFVETEMTKSLPEKIVEEAKNQILMKRFARAEEIARTIYFLGSDDSSYINGQVISVDGGISIWKKG